jgi:TolA-binding protein
MQIPITPGITLNMSQNGTRTVKVTQAEVIAAEAETERLELIVHQKQAELAELQSQLEGSRGRLLQLRGDLLLQERERLVEQRQDAHARAVMVALNAVEKALKPREKMTAAEHNAYPNGRLA